MEREVLLCKCYSVEHSMIVCSDDEGVYMYIHLSQSIPWYKRTWRAIRYIFGYKSRFGDFDEFIFNPEDAPKLEKIVEHLKNVK